MDEDDPGTAAASAPSARRAARDLLWTVPVAAVVSLVPYTWAAFTWCGFGCSKGGGLRSLGPVIPPLLVIGALLGAAVAVVPWTERRARRAGVSAAVGLAGAVMAGLLVVSL